MRKSSIALVLLFVAFSFLHLESKAQVKDIVGLWKTIDDETGEAKSYIKIYQDNSNGLYYGKIVKLLTKPATTLCTECKGNKKNKKVLGMIVVTKMEVDGDGLDDGKILDPNNGKSYYCSMELDEDNKDKLIVRGSVDTWGLAGRSQTWHRVK